MLLQHKNEKNIYYFVQYHENERICTATPAGVIATGYSRPLTHRAIIFNGNGEQQRAVIDRVQSMKRHKKAQSYAFIRHYAH